MCATTDRTALSCSVLSVTELAASPPRQGSRLEDEASSVLRLHRRTKLLHRPAFGNCLLGQLGMPGARRQERKGMRLLSRHGSGLRG